MFVLQLSHGLADGGMEARVAGAGQGEGPQPPGSRAVRERGAPFGRPQGSDGCKRNLKIKLCIAPRPDLKKKLLKSKLRGKLRDFWAAFEIINIALLCMVDFQRSYLRLFG